MSTSDTENVLNRVLAILRRSFPQYLRYARPYVPPGYAGAMETIRDIAVAQDALAERVSDQIFESAARPDTGEFATEFTDTHDLGIDYLIQEAIGYQKQDITELEACAVSPNLPAVVQSLAVDALHMAKGHLASLEELAAVKSMA